MKTSILNTEFNFAKNLSLIATTPNAYPSYPQGIKEFITPYLEALQDTFYYDPEVCYGSSPIINKFESLYTVTVPFTC